MIKNSDKLRLRYSKKERDIEVLYPLGTHTKLDCNLLLWWFCSMKHVSLDGRSLIEELEARGYDTTTIKFSIEPKLPNKKFPTLSDKYAVEGQGCLKV